MTGSKPPAAARLEPVASGPFVELDGNLHADGVDAIAAVGVVLGGKTRRWAR